MIPGPSSSLHDGCADDGIRTLTPADIGRLSLRNHPRLQLGDAEALVIQSPGLSKWHPASGEFLLVTPWRHRAEIPSVNVLSAFQHEDALLRAAVASADEQGAAGFVLLEAYEIRRPVFYARNHFEQLERILTYEHRRPEALLQGSPQSWQEFEPWFGAEDDMLEELLTLDHCAFPWLWWNSREEFLAYARMPFVEIWIGRLDGRVASYIGVTHFRRWSHLDRIAVMPQIQGQGLGRETLRFAVEVMVRRGAERVGLSTQRNNGISRHMYETAGFRETPELNYDVFGIMFKEGQRQMEAGHVRGNAGHGE